MKDKKRFKFRSFSERIATIKIDVIHRVGRPEDIPEDAESCFVDGLKKWRDLNSTADFTKFCLQASHLVQTFPQVVHHQDALLSLLKESLSSAADLALQPLLDLTVQLARDLQTDFYSHFQDYLIIISHFVMATDSQIVENAFTCLAYLIKFLWRHIVADIQPVYKLYCSLLLGNKKAHVRRFAAESFAFLIRKCSKQEEVVDTILQSCHDHENLLEGVGVLLFETMKGVNKQFHSSTKMFLFHLVMRAVNARERLGCEEKSVVVCLKKMMECMAEYCRQETSLVVWQVLLDCLTQVCDNSNAGIADHLCVLLELLHIWISWRKGARIMCPAKICKAFTDILPLAAQFTKLSNTLMALCSSLFTVLPNWSCDETLLYLLQSIYKSFLPTATIASFSLSLLECKDFKTIALPLLVSWLDQIIHKDDSHIDTVLWILTVISQHARKNHVLTDFSFCQHTHVVETVTAKIKQKVTREYNETNLVSLWAAIQCSQLLGLTSSMSSSLTDRHRELFQWTLNGGKIGDALLFVVCEMGTALLQLGDHSLQWNDIAQLLHVYPDSVFTLQIAYQFIDKMGIQSVDLLRDCSSVLLDNLTNPSQEIRLLSLKLLASLEETSGLFSLCLKIQEIPTSLEKYREKLAIMHQLAYNAQAQYRQDDLYSEVALRYLIGSFYLNLHPMWQPISELISTHAIEENKKVFWRVFSKQLRIVTQQPMACQKRDLLHNELGQLFYDRLDTQIKGCDDSRHDHVNFRVLLWKCMGDIVQVVEQRSRDVTPVFLEFIHSEYFGVDITSAPTQNVTVKRGSVWGEGGKRDEQAQVKGGLSCKEVLKMMKVMLALFGKFHNPKAMFREPEMKQVFTMLLTHRDREIQQRALDALMGYHPPYLIPYRDNLNRLLSEETMRDELVSFNVDEETSIVMPEHRTELLPILIRILYGRMMSQLGGKSGKQVGTSRRGMVLRFFAGCPGHEFAVFVSIAMQPFKSVTESTVAVRDIQVDPTAIVPLKKQQGFLNLLGQMLSQLSDQMNCHIPPVFHVLIYITHCCSKLLSSKRQSIQPHVIPCLRSIRQTALQRLTQIFQNYDQVIIDPFKDDLFSAAVWPQLHRLKDECIQHPTALLLLLHAWTKRSRDFPLLGEPCSEEMGGSVLGHVFACLFAKNVSMLVVSSIVEMADNLLENDNESMCGVRLVEPHVGSLLGYLSVSVKLAAANSKMIPKLHLSLLYKLSAFVKNSEQSEMLVQLLLKLLATQNHHGKEKETHILEAVKNLLNNVTSVETFLQPLSKLFYTLNHRMSRQALCDTFQTLLIHRTDLSPIARMLQHLNAWDRSRVDDVDFDSRLLGFHEASELVAGEPVDCDCLLPLVFSGCHTILHCDDMSLRNAASHFIQKVIQQVALTEGIACFWKGRISC
jgi:U3 small nucleolar RNA-associated protein 20